MDELPPPPPLPPEPDMNAPPPPEPELDEIHRPVTMSLEERIKALTGGALDSDQTDQESQEDEPEARKAAPVGRHRSTADGENDDDRMSLSSISSGDEKLELNINGGEQPTTSSAPQPPAPPYPPLPTGFPDFSKPPPNYMSADMWNQQAYNNYNNALNNQANQLQQVSMPKYDK